MENIITILKELTVWAADAGFLYIGNALKAALPVMGAVIVISIGVKVFKRFVK